jgi:hypothetical protein
MDENRVLPNFRLLNDSEESQCGLHAVVFLNAHNHHLGLSVLGDIHSLFAALGSLAEQA